jgi:DNA-binding NtrC family response regulator
VFIRKNIGKGYFLQFQVLNKKGTMEIVLTYIKPLSYMTLDRYEPLHVDLRNKHVLYIDDDYVNYLYFSELLSETGAQVERIHNTEEIFLSLASRKNICLIIVSSGYFSKGYDHPIVEKIKKIAPDIPVIGIIEPERHMIGNFTNTSDHSCDLFLSRYIDNRQLIETVGELINK